MNLKHLVLSFIVLLLAACSNEKTPVVTVLEIPALINAFEIGENPMQHPSR